MKLKIKIILCALALNGIVFAQQIDSINQVVEQVSINPDSLHRLRNEKDRAVVELDRIKNLNDQLSVELQQSKSKNISRDFELKQAKAQNLILEQHLNKTDTCLIDMASNFLYIPYEAYSIEKIAIPAFKNIYSSELKAKQTVKYDLLVGYQNDVKEMSDFLIYIQSEINKPFTKDGKAIVSKLMEQGFYKNYIQYSDYKSTYLGKFMVQIIDTLDVFDKEQLESVFKGLKKELDKCLDTVKDL